MKKSASLINLEKSNINDFLNIYQSTYKKDFINYFNKSFDNMNNKHNNKRDISFNCNKKKLYQKMICPSCINENIVNNKNEIKRKEKITDFFINKIEKKNNKNKINNINDQFNKTWNNGMFLEDIDYGRIRARKRELNNDNRIFGTSFCYTNKSCDNKNHIIKGKEYYEIINKQIENKKRKKDIEYQKKINEENKYIYYQIEKDKNRVLEEKRKKQKKINEINKINEILINCKKKLKNYEDDLKKKENEYILILCDKQNKEYNQKKADQKQKEKKIDYENYIMSQNNKDRKKNEKEKEDKFQGRDFLDLFPKNDNKKKCEQCYRKYPKNVLSPFYYSYYIEQNNS